MEITGDVTLSFKLLLFLLVISLLLGFALGVFALYLNFAHMDRIRSAPEVIPQFDPAGSDHAYFPSPEAPALGLFYLL